MKKITLILAVALTLLTACHSDDDTTPTTAEVGRITFEVVNYQQYSMDDPTRAKTYSVDSVSHLDFIIYDAENDTVVIHQHQKKGEEGYGTFSALLPYGSYNIVFLGYESKRREAKVDDITAICFEDNFVPHFFSKKLPVTIDKPEIEVQDVVLERAVACFHFISKGGVPRNLDTIMITSQGGSHHFDARTGLGKLVESRSYKYDMSSRAGQDTLAIFFYTFLTSPKDTMIFTVTAKDNEGNIIRTRDFKGVPMKINQITRYTGQFFDPKGSSGYTLSLDGKAWENDLHTY